jgi:uncharacterized membrane protein
VLYVQQTVVCRGEAVVTLVMLYAVTAIVFLALDALMLTFVMQPLFQTHIGHLLLPEIRIGAAATFYLAYIAGLIWLVSLPALQGGSNGQALRGGLVVGAMAYGTYEFTSYAVMRDWHPSMVATDVIWGTVLTGFAAWAGVAITRMMRR